MPTDDAAQAADPLDTEDGPYVPPERRKKLIALSRKLWANEDREADARAAKLRGLNAAAAEHYARRGLPVFPVHHVLKGGRCSCGKHPCGKNNCNAGKHPRVTGGHHAATTDVELIGEWWRKWPNANIGFHPRACGLVAIDIDPRNGGNATLAELEERYGKIESSLEQNTGGGGRHIIFKASPGLQFPKTLGGEGSGIDVKHDGLILLPPSTHRSGKRYVWIKGREPLASISEVTELPAWLARQTPLRPEADPLYLPPEGNTPDPLALEDDHVPAWVRSALFAINNDADSNLDYDTKLKLAMAVHATTNGSAAGFELVDEWMSADPNYDADTTRKKWESFRRKEGSTVGAGTLRKIATEHGWRDGGVSFGAVKDDEGEPRTRKRKSARFPFLMADDILDEAPEPVEYVIEETTTRGELVVSVGAPGSLKTTDMLHKALCIATGAPYHGRKTSRGAALFVGGENSAEEKRRIRADIKLHNRGRGIELGTLLGPVTLYSKDGNATADEKRIIETALAMSALGEPVKYIGLDNLRTVTAPGSTNKEEDVTTVMKALQRIRDATGATVEILHHTVRDGSRYAGSGAIESHADTVAMYAYDKASMCGYVSFGTKMRLGDSANKITFTTERVQVSVDTAGNPVDTIVLSAREPFGKQLSVIEQMEAADRPTKGHKRRPRKASENATLVLSAAETVVAEKAKAQGVDIESVTFTTGEVIAKANELRGAAGSPEVSKETLRAALSRSAGEDGPIVKVDRDPGQVERQSGKSGGKPEARYRLRVRPMGEDGEQR